MSNTPPHQPDSERQALAGILNHPSSAPAVLAVAGSQAFYVPRNRAVMEVVEELVATGVPPEPATVDSRLNGSGWSLADLIGLKIDAPTDGGALECARVVSRLATEREAIAEAGELRRAVETGELAKALPGVIERLDTLRRSSVAPAKVSTLGEFLAEDLEPGRWVLPDLLEAGDRLIVTALEGVGKSVLLRQIALAAAAGLHPLSVERIPPVRVLLLDLENPRRLVQDHLAALRAGLVEDHAADENLHVEVTAGIDLLDSRSAAELEAKVDQVRPQLLIGGPLYKMAAGDPCEEETARTVAAVLDRIRARHDCAVVLEAHTPHGNEERPYGASLWKRWPEFGIYLAPDGALRHWRGPRSERSWPAALRRGQTWPWIPAEVTRDTTPWNGPSRCAEAVLALLTANPAEELGVNAIHARLKAAGQSYRKETVSVAAESLVNTGKASAHNGPRNSRMFTMKEQDDDLGI